MRRHNKISDALDELHQVWKVADDVTKDIMALERIGGAGVKRCVTVPMQAEHLLQDICKMVFIMHGTPRPLEFEFVRLGAC